MPAWPGPSEAPGPYPRGPDLAARWAARLPRPLVATRRRRRLLFLALAAPGFFAVFGTPMHRNLFVALAGFILFAAALAFRRRTEPRFAAAAIANADPPNPIPTETRHA
jgi:hypothetical protein